MAGQQQRIHPRLAGAVTVTIIACPVHWDWPHRRPSWSASENENGILIKDAESLETARQVNAIVLPIKPAR